MTTFTYFCKKTNDSTDVEIESLPAESISYAIRRGLREYFDNYHASETLKAHGGDATKCAEAVRPLVAEAYDRLVAGDVPGTRMPADAKTARVRKIVRVFETLSDDEFETVLAAFVESRRAA